MNKWQLSLCSTKTRREETRPNFIIASAMSLGFHIPSIRSAFSCCYFHSGVQIYMIFCWIRYKNIFKQNATQNIELFSLCPLIWSISGFERLNDTKEVEQLIQTFSFWRYLILRGRFSFTKPQKFKDVESTASSLQVVDESIQHCKLRGFPSCLQIWRVAKSIGKTSLSDGLETETSNWG